MPPIQIATRRDFLTQGLGLVGVSSVLPNFLVHTALAAPRAEPGQRIMVILQLAGGHDAISALVPYGHAEYAKVRKATRIADNEVIKLNNELGLHPNLKGWKELLDQGAFAAIPGVGYPNPNYSHFTATDIWFAADPRGREAGYGWVGRACDASLQGEQASVPMIAIGTEKAPWALAGKQQAAVCFNNPETFRYRGDRNDPQRKDLFRKLSLTGEETPNPNLKWVTQMSITANEASEQVRRIASQYRPKVQYPNTDLGRKMQAIAGLIAGGLTTRVYWTSIGGFDTHRGQRQRHDTLMTQLNDAVFAFQSDLSQQNQAERVLTLTLSEFGRRVVENGSEGTDHGAAAAMFLFGPKVKPGIHGQHPSLSDLQGGGGGSLKHTTDFRGVFGSVVEKWMGVPAESVLGQKVPLIDCIA
jgi:uncharacterized protein (DUF1501 family)